MFEIKTAVRRELKKGKTLEEAFQIVATRSRRYTANTVKTYYYKKDTYVVRVNGKVVHTTTDSNVTITVTPE